jgi:hypothetical protein
MKLTKAQRATLFAMFGGRCAYCGCELPEKGWHADHIQPVGREWWKKGPKVVWSVDETTGRPVRTEVKQVVGVERPDLDTFDNLMPACRACNIDKHANSLEGWRRSIEHKVRVLRDNYSAFRHAERFGLVQVTEKPIVFYFELWPHIHESASSVQDEPLSGLKPATVSISASPCG